MPPDNYWGHPVRLLTRPPDRRCRLSQDLEDSEGWLAYLS